jgi:hypothetical protein
MGIGQDPKWGCSSKEKKICYEGIWHVTNIKASKQQELQQRNGDTLRGDDKTELSEVSVHQGNFIRALTLPTCIQKAFGSNMGRGYPN